MRKGELRFVECETRGDSAFGEVGADLTAWLLTFSLVRLSSIQLTAFSAMFVSCDICSTLTGSCDANTLDVVEIFGDWGIVRNDERGVEREERKRHEEEIEGSEQEENETDARGEEVIEGRVEDWDGSIKDVVQDVVVDEGVSGLMFDFVCWISVCCLLSVSSSVCCFCWLNGVISSFSS